MKIAHAEWSTWLVKSGGHWLACYCVKGERMAYSHDGFMWFDANDRPVDRPAPIIQYFGGPKDGALEAKP